MTVISIATFSTAGIGLGRGAALLATVAVVVAIVAAFAPWIGCGPLDNPWQESYVPLHMASAA